MHYHQELVQLAKPCSYSLPLSLNGRQAYVKSISFPSVLTAASELGYILL